VLRWAPFGGRASPALTFWPFPRGPIQEGPMRCFPRPLRFFTALFLLAYWCGMHAAPAFAGLVPSQPTGETAIVSERSADMASVQRALEHKVVAQKLRDYGVEPLEVGAKLATMSDEELHQLASATKGLPTGSDGVGLLIGVLIVVILVIVILKLMNREIVVR
jgi:hypothetical protein